MEEKMILTAEEIKKLEEGLVNCDRELRRKSLMKQRQSLKQFSSVSFA